MFILWENDHLAEKILPGLNVPRDNQSKNLFEFNRSSRKVAISALPVLSHHRAYRSGTRRFVRIMMAAHQFANCNNCRSLGNLPCASIQHPAFGEVSDYEQFCKLPCCCCPTYMLLILPLLIWSSCSPLSLPASTFAMLLFWVVFVSFHQAVAYFSSLSLS